MTKRIAQEDAIRIYQTGWSTLQVWRLRMASHTNDTFLDDMVCMPSEVDGFDDLTELANNSSTKFYGITDANILFLEWLNNVIAQAWTFIRGVRYASSFPTVGTGLALNKLFDDMKAGIFKRPMPWKDNAGASTTDFVEALSGLVWKDVAPSANECHIQELRRYIYKRGLQWRHKLIRKNERFEATSNIQLTRQIRIQVAMAILEWGCMPYVAAVASDKAVARLLQLRQNLIEAKVDEQYLKGVLDPIWAEYMRDKKPNWIDYGAPAESQCSFIDTWPSAELINDEASVLENSLKEYKYEYRIPDESIKLARQMFGIGKYESRGDTCHFAFLMDLANWSHYDIGGSESGVFDTNHLYGWEFGRNTYICQFFFKDIRPLWEDWDGALESSRHWTYEDISAWGKDMFSSFSLINSISGIAEPAMYRPLRMLWSFQAYRTNGGNIDGWLGEPVCWTPAEFVDVNNGHWERDALHNASYLLWLFPADPSATHYEHDRLLFPVSWTEEEYIAYLRLCTFFGTTSTIEEWEDVLMSKYYVETFRCVEVVNAKATDQRLGLLRMAGNAEVIRWEQCKNCYNGSYLSVNYKYGVALTDIDGLIALGFSPARLKGMDMYSYLNEVGDIDNKYTILEKVLMSQGFAAPAAVKDDKAPVAKADIIQSAAGKMPTANTG